MLLNANKFTQDAINNKNDLILSSLPDFFDRFDELWLELGGRSAGSSQNQR